MNVVRQRSKLSSIHTYKCESTQTHRRARTHTRTKLLARFPSICACVRVSVFGLLLSRCFNLNFFFFICFVFHSITLQFLQHTHTHGPSFHSTDEARLFSHCTYIGISHEGRWHTQFWVAAESVCYSADWMAALRYIHYSTHTELEKSQAFKHEKTHTLNHRRSSE